MRQKWIRNNNILEEEEERQNLIQSTEEEGDEVLILPLQHATDKPASLMDSRT
jgi:predicted deacetylase